MLETKYAHICDGCAMRIEHKSAFLPTKDGSGAAGNWGSVRVNSKNGRDYELCEACLEKIEQALKDLAPKFVDATITIGPTNPNP